MHDARDVEDGRGRSAKRPRELGKGWRDVLKRVRTEAKKDHLDVVAAGVAFYAFLSLFPALAAGVSLYGLVSDPQDAVEQLNKLLAATPGDVRDIIGAEAGRLAGQSHGALGLGLLSTLTVALWTANRGTKGLISALNITYDEGDERGFFKTNLMSLGLTLGFVLSLGVMLGLLVAAPLVLDFIGLGGWARTALTLGRWPFIALWILLSLAVLYRLGPSRQQPKWRWVTPGSLLATVLLVAASAGFAFYAAKFGSFNQTYGALGAVVVLLTWLYLSAYAILMGAELNAESEHQTKVDSTTGPDEPMGQRGAYAADTVGR